MTSRYSNWLGHHNEALLRKPQLCVDPRTLQVLGGWKTLAMVQRYAHLAPNHLQAAVERLVPSRGQAACQVSGGGTGVSEKYDSPAVAALDGTESESPVLQEVSER